MFLGRKGKMSAWFSMTLIITFRKRPDYRWLSVMAFRLWRFSCLSFISRCKFLLGKGHIKAPTGISISCYLLTYKL